MFGLLLKRIFGSFSLLMMLALLLLLSCDKAQEEAATEAPPAATETPTDAATASGETGTAVAVKQGKFLDSAVAGIAYLSGAQAGTTDTDGTFNYEEGNTVRFSVGGIVLGEGVAQAIVTPVEIVPGAVDSSNQAVTNIARFLQTLDTDGDPTNGIHVTVETAAAIQETAAPIDFNVSDKDFTANTAVSKIVTAVSQKTAATGGKAALVSAEKAVSHLMVALEKVPKQPVKTSGFVISAVSGATTESGETATFTVKLKSKPTADVSLNISSSNTAEGTVSPAVLTFTADNWNAEQIVTVTGVDDTRQDGPQEYSILLGKAGSADSSYDKLDAGAVLVTNRDNDTAGVFLSAVTGKTTEAGGTALITVKLLSAPLGPVYLSVTSSNALEGTVSPAALTFTADNWNGDQTLTITGVDDDAQDGAQAYQILLAVNSQTSASAYTSVVITPVALTNADNETAGVTVSAAKGQTTEAGGTATFTVKLNTRPLDNVTIPVSSSDISEGSVKPVSLLFTPVNWKAEQIVTVTGVDDLIADGLQKYVVLLAPTISKDKVYNGIDPVDVVMTTTDNETAGVTVSAISGNTTEAGGQATFTVKLNSQPTANVTLNLSSNDLTEGTVSPAALVFTELNWNANQSVTVTGANDNLADGLQSYKIILAPLVSNDAVYNKLDPADVSVSNTDNDSAGITVSAISGNTTEAGGTATFTIKLNSQPTADVFIALASGNIFEGTVSPSPQLTFTSANWNANQTVTVTGVNDDVMDGNQSYTIYIYAAVSTDTNYNSLNPNDLTLTNTDNDSAGYTISAISGNTTEALGTATFTVKLNSQPGQFGLGTVWINVSSSDTTEGTVSPDSLDFNGLNWNSTKTVTVTGVDDSVADGNQDYTIRLTLDTGITSDDYKTLDPADVSVSNTDNETAGFTISAISGNTTEAAAGTATFTIKLNSQPTGNVVVDIASSDTTEGTVSSSSKTFTTSNWNSNQTVTVTGVNDDVDDGNQGYTIQLTINSGSTADTSGYAALNPNDVSVTNTDDETAGFTISTISGNTTEAGVTATFTIKLNSQPTSNVTIGVSSSDLTEGTVDKSSLTFTSTKDQSVSGTTSGWNVTQTVTVTGVNDDIADGNQGYTITLAAAISSDINYNNLNPSDVSATNTDNETAGFTISAISGNTTEAGVTATFTMKLTSQPTGNVVINVATSDDTEGTVSTSSLIFTTSNWNDNQTVTVTGVDDSINDGNINYTIVLTINSGLTVDSSGYTALNPNDVSVTNTDDDLPPTQAAASVAFTDTDYSSGNIGGTVTITKASSESAITHYVLYWGSGSSTKLAGQSAISNIAVTGSNVTHTFSSGTAIPSGATYLLVRTKNAFGEMGTGVNTALTDLVASVTWTSRTSGVTGSLYDITYGNNIFVAVGDSGTILTSSDGISWTSRSAGTWDFYGITYGNNIFVAVGYHEQIYTSSDGISWTNRYTNILDLSAVHYANSTFVAVGASGGGIRYSSDGISWPYVTSGVSAYLNGITYGYGVFVVVGNGTIRTSNNPPVSASWYSQTTSVDLYSITYGNNIFVAVGKSGEYGMVGTILISSDAASWDSQTFGVGGGIYAVAYGNSTFVAVRGYGGILTSSSATSWTSRTSGTTANLSGITYGNNIFVAVGASGTILTSP